MSVSKNLIGLLCVLFLFIGGLSAKGDETTGVITQSGRGMFQINEQGMTRQFNLSMRNSQYEPTSWRPTMGDEVLVEFALNSKGILEVLKSTLVKAGPRTILLPDNPVIVDIQGQVRGGIRAKIPSGQIVEFSSSRSTLIQPAGWVPKTGEKASIQYQARSRPFSFDVFYVLDSMERIADVPSNMAPPVSVSETLVPAGVASAPASAAAPVAPEASAPVVAAPTQLP